MCGNPHNMVGTVGWLGAFPMKWAEATISPLYKKGNQADPRNYSPVSVLSHARKIIDATILTYVSDRFSPARTQFGFHPGISIQQAILEAQANAQRGLTHVAVLDLAKACDRVARAIILEAIGEHVDGTYYRWSGQQWARYMHGPRETTQIIGRISHGVCRKVRPLPLCILTYRSTSWHSRWKGG